MSKTSKTCKFVQVQVLWLPPLVVMLGSITVLGTALEKKMLTGICTLVPLPQVWFESAPKRLEVVRSGPIEKAFLFVEGPAQNCPDVLHKAILASLPGVWCPIGADFEFEGQKGKDQTALCNAQKREESEAHVVGAGGRMFPTRHWKTEAADLCSPRYKVSQLATAHSYKQNLQGPRPKCTLVRPDL